MKKIVVMSDNHGNYQHPQLVLKEHPDASLYVHCGDNEGWDDQLEQFIAVRGNNDWNSDFDRVKIFEFDGMAFGVLHGDQFGYFSRERYIEDFINEYELDVILCGHTHMPMNIRIGEAYVINPGSTYLPRGGSKPSYAVIYKDGKDLQVEFVEVKK